MPKLIDSPVPVKEVWEYTRQELSDAAKLCFPVGPSDGGYYMNDVKFRREIEFDNKDEICCHLGYPIGSKHVFAYGFQGEGQHVYEVVHVERELRIDPRDGSVYGKPRYAIQLKFVEELTPDNFWAQRLKESGKENEDRWIIFSDCRDTFQGCSRLDVNDHRTTISLAIQFNNVKVSKEVLEDYPQLLDKYGPDVVQ